MIPSFNRPTGNESVSELADMVAQLQKQVEFLMTGNLSTKNIHEVGKWLADDDRLVSEDGDVGMSSAETGGDDVRFWSGSTDMDIAPWRVSKSGKMHATGATIESSAGYPKIVMDPDGRLFAAYTSEDTYVGITPDYLGNGPGQIAVRGGVTEGGSYTTSAKYHLVAVNGLKLESGEDIEFAPGGSTGVIFSNWSRIYSSGAGQSLQSALNAKAISGASTSSVGNHNHGIPDGTVLSTPTGTVTWSSSGGHSHSQT